MLEWLEGDQALNQVCPKYEVTSKSLRDWKATFLANESLAFNVESAVSGYKEALAQKEKKVNELHRQPGKRMAELEWASKKLKSLGYSGRKSMIDTKFKSPAIVKQCERLAINRSNVCYKSQIDDRENWHCFRL